MSKAMDRESSTDVCLDDLLSHARDGVFVLDKQRRYLLYSRACERLTGYAASDVLGGVCGQVGVTDCRDEQGRALKTPLCPAWSVFKGGAPSVRRHMRITTKSGDQRWVETHSTPILDDDGEPEGVISVVRGISDAKGQEPSSAETTDKLREEAGLVQLDGILADIERRTIRAALHQAHGQRSLAAKLMGISRSRLYRRMDALGIVPREEKF